MNWILEKDWSAVNSPLNRATRFTLMAVAALLLLGDGDINAGNKRNCNQRCRVRTRCNACCCPPSTSCTSATRCPPNACGSPLVEEISTGFVEGVKTVNGKELRSKTFTWEERKDVGDCEWRAGETTLTIWENGDWDARSVMHCNARPYPFGYCEFRFGLRASGTQLFESNYARVDGGGGHTVHHAGNSTIVRDYFDTTTYAARRPTGCTYRH